MSTEIEPTEENTAPDYVAPAPVQAPEAAAPTAEVAEPQDEPQDEVLGEPNLDDSGAGEPPVESTPEAPVAEEKVEEIVPVGEVEVKDAAPAVTAQATQDLSVAAPQAAAPVAADPVFVITPVAQTTAGTDADYAFQDFVNKIAQEGCVHSQVISNALQTYINIMKPGAPVEPTQGGRQQVILWRALLNMINNAGEQFNEAFNVVLHYFREYGDEKKVLGEHYVCRFAKNMTQLSKEEVDSYWLLLNLLRTIVRSNSRADAIRQIDLGRTLTSVYSEEGRARLTQFITN